MSPLVKSALLSLVVFSLSSCGNPGSESVSSTAIEGSMRGYVDTRAGQLHYYRVDPPKSVNAKTPIILFHPSPRSGLIYKELLTQLGRDRIAIAFDTPGFGSSDGLSEPPTMNDLALIMGDALLRLGLDENEGVDVFGFHTGTLIASELSIIHPELVRRVVLSGIPWREDEDRQALFDRISQTVEIDRSKVEYAWVTNVELREEGVSFDDATKSFAENVKALSGDYWHAYYAVWSYPIEEQLTKIPGGDVLILNYPFDTEFESTRIAHERLLPDAQYVELEELEDIYFPFTANASTWVEAMTPWLDNKSHQD